MAVSRRQILAAGISIASTVLVATKNQAIEALFRPVIEEGAEALEGLFLRRDWNTQILDRKHPIDAENTRLLGKLIGYQADRTFMLAGGREHFRHPGVMHHDNEWAANTVVDIFRGFKPAVESTEKLEELDPQGEL